MTENSNTDAVVVDVEDVEDEGEENENEDVEDNDIFMVFPYKSFHQEELRVILEIFKNENKNNENNNNNGGGGGKKKGKKKKNKGKKKFSAKEGDIETFEFTKLNLPEFILPKSNVYSAFSKEYCLFYADLNEPDLSNKIIRVVQKCDRGTIKGGVSDYYSNEVHVEDKIDKYLFNLKFNYNNNHWYYKAPNGDRIESSIDRLLMFLSFIWLQKPTKLFQTLNQFIDEFEKESNIIKLRSSYEMQKYIAFIIEFFENKGDFKDKPEPDANVVFVCCLLGFLSFEAFANCQLDRVKIDSEFIINLLITLNKKEKINQLNGLQNVNKYLQNGLCFVFYNCLNEPFLIDHLVALINTLAKFNMDVFNSIVDSFLKSDYLYKMKTFMSKKDAIIQQIQYLQNVDEKKVVIGTLIQLCPSINGFFELLELLSHELVVPDVVAEKTDFIKQRFLAANVDKSNYKNVIALLDKFKKNDKLLTHLSTDFYVYFIQINENFQKSIEFIQTLEIKEQYSPVWNVFLEEIARRAKDLEIKTLVELMEIMPSHENKPVNADLVKQAKQETKRVIQERISRIQLPFDDKEKEILFKVLNNENIFPFGSIKFIKERKYIEEHRARLADAKFLLNRIFPVQFHKSVEKADWQLTFEAYFYLIIEKATSLEETVQSVCQVFESLKNEMKQNEETGDVLDSIFKFFLKEFFKYHNSNIDLLMKLMNYQNLFAEQRAQDTYINFVNEKVFNKLKDKSTEEIIRLVESILSRVNTKDKNALQTKLVSTLFASAGNYEEASKKTKELLFENPNKDHFLYKVLYYSSFFLEINKTKFVVDIKENIRNCIIDLSKRKIYISDVESLRKLKRDQIDILKDYVDAAFQDVARKPAVMDLITDCIDTYDANIRHIGNVCELLGFLKGYLQDHDTLYQPLFECIQNKNKLTIDQIVLPRNCDTLRELIRVFPCDFSRLRHSNVFKVIFNNCYKDFVDSNIKKDSLKKSSSIKREDEDAESIFDLTNLYGEIDAEEEEEKELVDIGSLKEIFKMIVEQFKIIAPKLTNEESMSNSFLEKYFNQTQYDKIDSEIQVLKEVIGANDRSLKFLKTAVMNYSQIKQKKSIYKQMLECFETLGLSKEGTLSRALNEYISMVSSVEYDLEHLNTLVMDIDKMTENVVNNQSIIDTIGEMSKAKRLLDYLESQNEDDIRSAIDSLDEHGDNYIRVQNILELCKVSQFIKKLDIKHEDEGFLKSLNNVFENDAKGVFRNISAMIHTSVNLLDGIKLIMDTIHNREEADKTKISDIGRSAEFKIQFHEDVKSFNLKTVFRGKIELSLNELYDLRDRALLMVNNQKNAQNFLNIDEENEDPETDEALKKIHDVFIKSIESLNNIVGCMNLIYENGYPIDELHPTKILRIHNSNNKEIIQFEEEISSILGKWQQSVTDLMYEYKILSYFWGRELFKIEKALKKKEFNKVKDHLSFVNMNILKMGNDKFPEYPNINNATPFDRLRELATYLNKLIETLPKQDRILMPTFQKGYETDDEQIILMKSDSHFFTNALLMCYRDYERLYPVSNQILFCNGDTTWQEVRSFLFRIMANKEKYLYAIIGPERLSFEQQDLFLNLFVKLMTNNEHFIRLALITNELNNHIVDFLSQLGQPSIKLLKTQYQNDQAKLNAVKVLIQHWQKGITCVTSSVCGLGKSKYVEQQAKIRNSSITKYPISECGFRIFAERLKTKKYEMKNNQNYTFHFDIYGSNDDESLNEFLFIITMLKIFKCNDFVFVEPKITHFFIEIANTYSENLRRRVNLSSLVDSYHIEQFSIDNLILPDNELVGPIRSDNRMYLQVVCNYLKLIASNQCNQVEFKKQEVPPKFSNIYEYTDMVILDENTCRNLLKNYFQTAKVPINSYIQFRNFINLLGYYLLKFSENAFFSLDIIGFIISGIQSIQLRQVLMSLREKLINMLFELSIKGVTQSIQGARFNALQTFENLNKLNDNQVLEDNKDLEMEAQKYILEQFKFDNCEYLLVVFSEVDGQINLVYSKVDVIPKHIISLLKSQDVSKLQSFAEPQLLAYINNDNDLGIFKDYQKQTHDDLLTVLHDIFKPNKITVFEFEKERFNHDKELSSIIEKFNKKLFQIAAKLNTYVLSADNFLKMILIYNKIKSDLPVVIMGETGCGKTSLISYLGLKILNVKLIIYNIHAGITQRAFLTQIRKYIKIAETIIESEVWVFFDEFNTSECMFLIAEMICKRTLLGNEIPVNMKLLAACNPYKLKSKNLDIGLVKQRNATRLLHIVHPLPDTLIDHVWDFGALSEQDEKNYVLSMIKNLKSSNHKMLRDLICYSQRFICKIEEASSVSLRDVDRFRIFYEWFTINIKQRHEIDKKNQLTAQEFEKKCIILSLFICYFIRLSTKSYRESYIKGLIAEFNQHSIIFSTSEIMRIFTEEQNEYLNRMNLQKGIAKNTALRENVFATFVCIMNKVPIFICGKPGCSKTLCIQLLASNLRGIHSIDPWFKELPDIYSVTYQGSESSTSEGISKVFEKAKEIVENAKKAAIAQGEEKQNTMTPLIVFDEMGLAELSRNNPLKVLHSLLENDNTDVAFVGISNWRLDASKMNRGIFLSRPDLSQDDLEDTAVVIFKSYIKEENKHLDISKEKKLMESLAKAYFNYKTHMRNTNYPDFHGTRDFYYLIKQISEKLTERVINSNDEVFNIVEVGLRRNFEGIKDNPHNIFDEFKREYFQWNEAHNISTLELIKMNLEDHNSRYLMLITRSDSATYILDNFLNKSIKNRITFVGSKFEGDINNEEYSFRTLSDIILFMEKGWTVVMQDMDHIYGSLYDLFNQNFTITGGNKKNCRIALGSVINPMCFVNDQFHCIVILQEELLSKCEPPFLNRFEKHILNFEAIMNEDQLKTIKSLKEWINLLFNLSDPNVKSRIKLQNIIVNCADETLASLVIYYSGLHNEYNQVFEKCREALIKVCSNFALVTACESKMYQKDEIEVKRFIEDYKTTFQDNQNLNTYVLNIIKNKSKSFVYTFDSITKQLNLEINKNEEYDEVKVGSFDSEKNLSRVISQYYKSNKKLLLIRMEWLEHAQHLQLIKFLIDKVELDNNISGNNELAKPIVIVIHLNFYNNNIDELEKYKMSFLSGWDQVMIDSLDNKMTDLCDILFYKSNELITNEKVISFDDVCCDLFVNAVNKINYKNVIALDGVEFDNKIYHYKNYLIDQFTLNADERNLKVFDFLKDVFKKKFWSQIDTIPDTNWRMEVLTNPDLLRISFDIKVLLKNLILLQITFPFVETLYSVERYFPFESMISAKDQQDFVNNLFYQILSNMFDANEKEIKAKNADHSNDTDAMFGLKTPFITREIEKLDKIGSIADKLKHIDDKEKEIKCLDIGDEDFKELLMQNLALLRELVTFVVEVFDNQSIYSRYPDLCAGNELFFKGYLRDLVKIKFLTIFKCDELMEEFAIVLLKIVFQSDKVLLRKDEIDKPGIYYYLVTRYKNFILKAISFIDGFKHVFSMNSLIRFLETKNFEEDDVNVKNHHFTADKVLVYMLDFTFNKLIEKCSDPDSIKSISFKDIVSHFKYLFLEFFTIRMNYRLQIESYQRVYFMSELMKTLEIVFKDDNHNGKIVVQKVASLIGNKLKNDEFLGDIEILRKIIQYIRSYDPQSRTFKVEEEKEERDPYEQIEDEDEDEDESEEENVDENIDEKEKALLIFENFSYTLALSSTKDTFILSQILDQFCKNKSSMKTASSLLQKLINDIVIDIDCEFTKEDNQFLDVLNKKFGEIGLDSDLAVIFSEVLSNNIDEIDDDNFIEWTSNNADSINNLYETLKNYENGFQNEVINTIRYKNIAYLTSISYLKQIIRRYCEQLLNGETNEELHQIFNGILSDPNLKISNSLRILAIKVLYDKLGSYAQLKDFVMTNLNIRWRNLLEFAETKGMLDIILKSKGLDAPVKDRSKEVQSVINTKVKDQGLLNEFKKHLEANIPEDNKLSANLAVINTVYLSNTNNEFFSNDSTKTFTTYFQNELRNSSANESHKQYIHKLITNFNMEPWLKSNPQIDVNDLKLISIILHIYSITSAYNKFNNAITALLHNSNQNVNNKSQVFWTVTPDDEEYEILYLLKDIQFISYTPEQIQRGDFTRVPGFALIKCSDECKFYYTVGNCTNITANNQFRCPKGHLLGGVSYGVMHARPGHIKIEDASTFIAKRLNELIQNAPRGYIPHEPNNDATITVRTLKAITYRTLHLLLHSNLYMLQVLQFYSDHDIKNLLQFQQNNFQVPDLRAYLKSHIENDYKVIGKLLGSNDQYIFIHSILYELPQFLKENNFEIRTIDDRNRFELNFENMLIVPKINSPNEVIIRYKNMFAVENKIDEISLLLNESTDEEFLQNMKQKYILLNHMRINPEISLESFENKFNISNMNKKYRVIDLFLKNKESLEKLEVLPLLIKLTNYLMNEYDHKITRNQARQKTLIECFNKNENILKDFEKLKELWNTYLNLDDILKDGCNRYKGIELKDNSPLSLLLVDNKPEVGSGIQTRMAFQYLAACQNEFLEHILSFADNLTLLKNFNRDPLAVHLIGADYIVNVLNFDFETHIMLQSFINPEYGKGMEPDFEYEKLEFVLLNKLVVGKRLINTEKDKFRTIQYSGELLNENVHLISNLRDRIPQEPIDLEKKMKIKEFIDELIENKDNNGYEIMQNIFSSLNTFICFMNSNVSNKPELTLRQYADDLKLRNISDYIRKNDSLSTLCLKNIVEVYEIFENEMFYLMKHQFDDKYKKDLDNDLHNDFQAFLNQCDGTMLPERLEFYNALKRFSMRCLFADLDENQTLCEYLSFRPDLWPSEGFDDKSDALSQAFPPTIKLNHSLGNMMKRLDDEFNKPKIEQKSKEIKIDSPKAVGGPANKSAQQQKTKKLAKKFEMM